MFSTKLFELLVALRQSLGECGLRVKAQQRRECNRVYIGNEKIVELLLNRFVERDPPWLERFAVSA